MANKRKVRLPEGDDGHTIANMNVEGMPWYRPERKNKEDDGEMMSDAELRMYTFGALKATLLALAVFIAAIVGFVAFCVFVWFK